MKKSNVLTTPAKPAVITHRPTRGDAGAGTTVAG